MKIIYTIHAEDRLKKRCIKEEWIKHAVSDPDKLIDTKYGRKHAVKKINNEEISVIYVKEGNNFIIITMYWGE